MDDKGSNDQQECIVDLPIKDFVNDISPPKSIYYSFIKPLYDRAFALVMMVSISPILLLIMLLVKIDSKGPVIFKQKRVGLLGKVFTMYKFRSMCESHGIHANPFTEKDDPRLTRIGKFIRYIHADELPQLWNVLKGQMSLIGPRPEQVDIVKQFTAGMPKYSIRHIVKPGITGWAQVKYKYTTKESEMPMKLHYDIYYIQNISMITDLYVMLATVKVVLLGQI